MFSIFTVKNGTLYKNNNVDTTQIKSVVTPSTAKVIYASATCGVTLPAHYKGTHMSRFVEVLNQWREKKTLDIKDCVESMVEKLDAK